MTSDIDQKKQECWEGCISKYGLKETPSEDVFSYIFDYAYSLLGKDDKRITIDKEEYQELRKYRRYVYHWGDVVVCPHCGEFNPSGYICASCGKDSSLEYNN